MRIGELMRTRGQISGVPTGFRELDELTSGLQKGDLIIVAARPSVGKSTFAMNIAEYAATTAGKRVAVFSLEMSREQLTTRMLCSQAKVDMQKVNSGETTEEDLLVLSDALLTLSDSKCISTTAATSALRIYAAAAAGKRRAMAWTLLWWTISACFSLPASAAALLRT